MNEDEAYLDIAIRYLESCNEHINTNTTLQEVIGFNCYHSFESAGGAYNSHYGQVVPKAHARKLNAFVANTRHNTLVNGRAIAAIATMLNSLRNKYLYPEQVGYMFIRPQDQLSMTDCKRLVAKVRGILRQIERLI